MAPETAARRVMESKPEPTANAALPSGAMARGDQVALAYRTAGELLRALASRRISSRELVDGAISRIEALDQKINAVVVRDFDRARAAADDADARCRSASKTAAAHWRFDRTGNAFSGPARPGCDGIDLHPPLRAGDDLEDAFAWKEERTLSKTLTLQYP